MVLTERQRQDLHKAEAEYLVAQGEGFAEAAASFCKCADPNCPARPLMRKIRDMPTNGDVWSIETVSGSVSYTHLRAHET